MSGYLDEDAVERYAIELLKDLGYAYLHGRDIAPGGAREERSSFKDAVLVGRLRSALTRLNPTLPAAALADALQRILGAPDASREMGEAGRRRVLARFDLTSSSRRLAELFAAC